MKNTTKFAVALLLAVLIGTSGAAALFAGQAASVSAQGETVKAAGAEAIPQTTQEQQEKEKALRAAQDKEIRDKAEAAHILYTPIVKTYSLK